MTIGIDPSTEFGARVARRLSQDLIVWLTTVRNDSTPQPSPVWFHWDGETFLIYSQPNNQKLRNIARSAKVALHLDGDSHGHNIVIFTGDARIADDAPPLDEVPAYVTKYQEEIAQLGMTPATFSQAYSIPIRVTPTGLRGN